MLTKLVRRQLVAFAIIAVLGVLFASVTYLRLPQLLGFGQYHLAADLPAGGGIYPNAVVSLRGVPVGKVSAVTPTPAGVRLELSIDNGISVPRDATAAVRSMSAIGEQYVDLAPGRNPSTHALADGASVPAAPDAVPVSASTLLGSADDLVRSIPRQQLSTTVDELSTAFAGTADDLQRLVDSSQAFLDTARDNVGPTKQLLDQLVPVLRTQQAIGGDIRSFVPDLDAFTRQLTMSDADIRAVIANGPGFMDQIGGLTNDLNPTLPITLSDLAATGQVLNLYLPNIKQTLVLYPAVIATTQAISIPEVADHAANVYFRTTVNDPAPCTTGFDQNARRDPRDTTPRTENGNAYCKVPQSSPLAPRGARNQPCPNDPARRSADAAGCGLNFDGKSPTVAVPYDPGTGAFQAPDGLTYFLGGAGQPAPAKQTWQSLLLGPLGRSA